VIRRIAAAALLLAAAAGRAGAQQGDSLKPYAIPASPAFTFLGTTPGKVERPVAARALALGLAQDVAASGGIPRGLALDVAPWSFVPGLRIPLRRYQTDPAAYALANTQLSVGTIQPQADTAGTDLAVGVRTTLFDRGDPMADTAYTSAVRKGLVQCQSAAGPTDPDSVVVACARRVTGQLRTRWREDHWNAASLAFAAAAGWRFPESQVTSSDWLGWAGWATAALPLFKGGQVLGQLRYDVQGANRHGLTYGGRAYLGTPSVNVFAEVTHDGVDTTGTPTSWAGGLELRVLQSFWLSTGVGTVARPDAGAKTVAVIANLRWDVSTLPRFGRLVP
jgi:hypothetical protein